MSCLHFDSVNFDKLPFIFFKYCGYYIFTCTVCFHLSASDIFRFLFLLLPMSRHDCCLLQCLVYKCFISLSGMSFSCHLQVFILLVACFIWLFSFRELTGLKCHITAAHFLSLSVQREQWIYRNTQTYIHAHMYPHSGFQGKKSEFFLKKQFPYITDSFQVKFLHRQTSDSWAGISISFTNLSRWSFRNRIGSICVFVGILDVLEINSSRLKMTQKCTSRWYCLVFSYCISFKEFWKYIEVLYWKMGWLSTFHE